MKIHNLTICEQARMEVNGKFFLIGVFGNEVTFPSLPATFNFMIWFMVEHEVTGTESIEIRGTFTDTGKEVLGFGAEVDVETVQIWSPVGVANSIQVDHEGEFLIEAKLGEADWHEVRRLRFRQGQFSNETLSQR